MVILSPVDCASFFASAGSRSSVPVNSADFGSADSALGTQSANSMPDRGGDLWLGGPPRLFFHSVVVVHFTRGKNSMSDCTAPEPISQRKVIRDRRSRGGEHSVAYGLLLAA